MSSPLVPGNKTRASAAPPTGMDHAFAPAPQSELLQISAPSVLEDSRSVAMPPLTVTLLARVVTSFILPPSIADHLLVSSVVPLNSSWNASCHVPGGPSGVR